MEEKFLSQYSHWVPHKPTVGDLTAEKMRANEDFVTFASRWRDMAARSECYIPESQAIEIIARNSIGALRAGLLVSDFHTYPQLYERATRVLHNKDELPFLEPEGKGRKKTTGHTIEGIIGSMVQLTMQQNQKGWRNQQHQSPQQESYQGQPK